MKKSVLTKQLIESIVRNQNTEYVEEVQDLTMAIVGKAIEDLSKQISYISTKNIILQPANELLNGAMTDNSKFVYFLGVDNAQIDLNTVRSSRFWKNLKVKIVYAWKNRKVKRKSRRKRKKEALLANEPVKIDFDPASYNIYNLSEDLQMAMAKYVGKTTMLYLNDNKITIVGKEDFGSNTQIVLYVVLHDGEKFKYFLNKKQGYLSIDFNSRINCLNQKIDAVGDVFVDVLKIFNVLYFDVNNFKPNQVFLESILYNCPNNLFVEDDAYNSFIKIINYLTIKSFKDFKSIENNENSIFKDKVCGNSAIGFMRLMNELSEIKTK